MNGLASSIAIGLFLVGTACRAPGSEMNADADADADSDADADADADSDADADTDADANTDSDTDIAVPPGDLLRLETFESGEGTNGLYLFFLESDALGYTAECCDNYVPTTGWWTPGDLLLDGANAPWQLPQGAGANIGDVTGDGIDDLGLYGLDYQAVPNQAFLNVVVPGPISQYAPSSSLGVEGPPGSLRFPATADYDIGTPIRAGDVSGDGVVDFCGAKGCDYGPPDGVLDTRFDPPLIGHEAGMVAFDTQGDSAMELIAEASGDLYEVVVTPGVIDFREGRSVPLSPDSLAVHDFGDGPVLVAAMHQEVWTISAEQFGNGEHTVLTSNAYTSGPAVLGDFDGNGATEVAREGSNGTLWLLDLDGTFRREISPLDGGQLGHRMAAGDLDQDGIDELLVIETNAVTEAGVVYYLREPLVGF